MRPHLSASSAPRGEAGTRPPPGWWRWRLDGEDLGWLAPSHQAVLSAWDLGEPTAGPFGEIWVCYSGALHAAGRSAWIGALAQRLREAGRVRGWRDEAYRCQLPQPGQDHEAGPAQGDVFFDLERAAYRFFGLTSQAVHINGVTPDGALWCGRRSQQKATDPGRLDNLAAGGLPAGEDPMACAQRELWEEAGVPASISAGLRRTGLIRTRRVEPEGWHDEWLHVFDLTLPAEIHPVNRDGEVSGFERLAAEAVAQRLATRDFSPDAAAVSALWLAGRGD